jgi:hypothetical protein
VDGVALRQGNSCKGLIFRLLHQPTKERRLLRGVALTLGKLILAINHKKLSQGEFTLFHSLSPC